MGRIENVISRNSDGTVEVEVIETTEIAQLISGGILIRTDKKTVETGCGFIAKVDLNDGSMMTATMRIPKECKNDLWIEVPWRRVYETEKDYR
ncbi:MAG: hypothetical protein H8E12_09040 [Rhodobacteraceae bacterium]|nr:hypothetical protein [Paracoccaceae bacterium]